MSAIGAILAGVAAKIGAPIVRDILTRKIGPAGGALAETVIKTVAEKVGVEPEALETVKESDLETAVLETEAIAPELLSLYLAGLEGQFELLTAETEQGGLSAAWRWGWMYLLAVFWTFTVLIFPIAKAGFGVAIDQVDIAVLMTLTTWFIGLYMGGHTVKSLGQSAIEAVKSWKHRR